MAQTKPLSEMSKEELTIELDDTHEAAEHSVTFDAEKVLRLRCLVLIGMLQLKNRE